MSSAQQWSLNVEAVATGADLPHNQTNKKIPYVMQWCVRAVNRSSGPDLGRILFGKASKSDLRPAFGRPEGGFLGFPIRNPADILPVSSIPGPGALLCNLKRFFGIELNMKV